MPYVAPIVGFFGRALNADGKPAGWRLRCATCADGLSLDDATVPIFADEPPHNTDPCDICGQPLTTDPRQNVHVEWSTKPTDFPVVRRAQPAATASTCRTTTPPSNSPEEGATR